MTVMCMCLAGCKEKDVTEGNIADTILANDSDKEADASDSISIPGEDKEDESAQTPAIPEKDTITEPDEGDEEPENSEDVNGPEQGTDSETEKTPEAEDAPGITEAPEAAPEVTPEPEPETTPEPTPVPTSAPAYVGEGPASLYPSVYEYSLIGWDESLKYADFSKIHETPARMYKAPGSNRKGIVVTVNAGHGTKDGSKVKTLCHPDGSAKVTGGSTASGEKQATAISYGTSMLDGTPEFKVNLALACVVRDLLIENGYDVLMIRENNETQLDNIARTVLANNYSDCHIAIHYDSTENDKGFFYIGVPNNTAYRSMEPVASHWQEHNALGKALLGGVKECGLKVYGDGNIPLDLTQTSYSTVPSVDIEVGDRGSNYSAEKHAKIAQAILIGLDDYFGVAAADESADKGETDENNEVEENSESNE